jgi:hypothetical protein
MTGGGPEVPPATIPAVDQAVAALADVAEAPPAQQVGPLAEADRVLRETLDSIGDV